MEKKACGCERLLVGSGDGVLEVCVDSVESALAAVRGGADRLEICGNLIIGGTTPGVSLFRQIREVCDVELYVLLRPRYGDFLYTEREFQMILEDGRQFFDLGADGIVAGCLWQDGSLDRGRMEQLRRVAGQKHLTLHRAFDMCADPFQTLEEAVGLGVDTILTSGQQETCIKGKKLLGRLIRQAGERVEILAGSGVNAEVIACLAGEIQARAFHMSGKKVVESRMIYRKEEVSMGIPGMGEYSILRTDEKEIQRASAALRKVAARQPASVLPEGSCQ